MRSSFCAVLLALLALTPAAAQARTIDFSDLRKEVGLASPQISPDGKLIAVVASHADFDKDHFLNQLMLVDVASGARRALTQDRYDVHSPRWSPSGDRIAFLAQTGEGEKAHDQIFVLSMNGGEPVAVTHAENGVNQFAWSPDGTKFAYVSTDAPVDKKAIEKHDDGFVVGDNDFLTRSAPTPAHLWTVSADGTDSRRITSGSWSLPKGPFSSDISWSPDGKSVVFEKMPDAFNSHWDRGSAAMVDVASGSVRPMVSDASWSGGAQISPDGTRVAYQTGRHGSPYLQVEVSVAGIDGTGAVLVTRQLDRNIGWLHWMPDGKSLAIMGNDRTQKALWLQPVGGAASRIDMGDASVFEASVSSSGAMALIGEDGTHPGEVYYVAPGSAVAKKLTDFNAAIAALDLGKMSGITWQGPDGATEDGVLTYPPNFDPAKKYPLVLMIHGGPISASTETFDGGGRLPQIAAAKGWIVFEPNYRGSDNLGDAYLQAIVGDVTSGPGKDVLSGVAAVQKMGMVDASRIGVSGWSGGGLQTTWLVGHAHIWKAAVAGAAVTNWIDQYALADISSDFTAAFFGGSPWDSKFTKLYWDESPITYARAVRTPTLIISDVNDYRVPISQSFEFYHAIKDNGVEAKFVALPRVGHFPSDPAGVEAVDKLWIGWFEDHLK